MLKYLQKETVQHGNSEFPVKMYTIPCNPGSSQILPCHWHEEYEILHVFSGSAEFRIGEKFYRVDEGSSLFVNSGELHSAHSNHPAGCGYYAIVFHMSFLNSSLNDVCQSRYITPLMLKGYRLPHVVCGTTPVGNNLNSLILEMIYQLNKNPPGYELFIKGSFFMILSLLARELLLKGNSEGSMPSQKDRVHKIKKVIEYISDNYPKKITIEEMAAITGMNKYNFCRFFKKYAGITPLEYLNMYRINEACRLFEATSCNITEAALQVGFDNMSYFSKTFRKYKNITPSGYRRGDV